MAAGPIGWELLGLKLRDEKPLVLMIILKAAGPIGWDLLGFKLRDEKPAVLMIISKALGWELEEVEEPEWPGLTMEVNNLIMMLVMRIMMM